MNKDCYYQLASDLTIDRIVNGMWQVAGGHGNIDNNLAIEGMIRYHKAGFTSWDLADIYGPAEDFVGEFRRKLLSEKGEQEELSRIQVLTKCVPQPSRITHFIANENIERSLRRMDVSSLDLLQFHIWMLSNTYQSYAIDEKSNI